MLSSAGHTSLMVHPHQHHSYQQLKPSPLSSADNAPRSLHLNAVQAVNTHYTTPTAYTHTHSNSSSNSVTTSSNSSYLALPSLSQSQPLSLSLSPPPPPPSSSSSSSSAVGLHAPAHKGLRRVPGGANLAEYSRHQHPHPQQHLRTSSLSSSLPNGPKNSNMNGGGGASAAGTPTTSTGAAGMPSINAIAAGPGPASAAPPHPHGARFDGPRSPPSEFIQTNSPRKIHFCHAPLPLPPRGEHNLPTPTDLGKRYSARPCVHTLLLTCMHATLLPDSPSTPSTSMLLCDLEANASHGSILELN